jgi:hypothetical protein
MIPMTLVSVLVLGAVVYVAVRVANSHSHQH